MIDPLESCADLPVRICEPGDLLLEEGKPGNLFVMRDGAVEILKGEFQIDVVAEPGSIFGEMSALLGVAPTATVRALERSTFHFAEDGLGLLSSRPGLALFVARLLARRLNSVTSYLVDLKKQFGEREDHLGIVDEVLESLVHDQEDDEIERGSDREPDPND